MDYGQTYTETEIAQSLLDALKMLNLADNQRLARQRTETGDLGPYGHVHTALVQVLQDALWPESMALAAIRYAMAENVTMREALYAAQTG